MNSNPPLRRSLRNARAKHYWAITNMRVAHENAQKFLQNNQKQRAQISFIHMKMFHNLAKIYKQAIDAAEGEIHVCKTCDEAMNDYDFQRGKMCCDKPMFHDDEEPEDDSDFEDDE